MTTTSTVQARCGECNHIWVVAHLPMPLDQAAKLMMAARCPHGHAGKVFVA